MAFFFMIAMLNHHLNICLGGGEIRTRQGAYARLNLSLTGTDISSKYKGVVVTVSKHIFLTFCNRFEMADEIDLAIGSDSFRLGNPPPWTACLHYASMEVDV